LIVLFAAIAGDSTPGVVNGEMAKSSVCVSENVKEKTMTHAKMVQKTLKAGTVVHVQGIPLELAADTTVNTTEGNFEVMQQFAAEERAAEPAGQTGASSGSA
jgi:hypothetical protein